MKLKNIIPKIAISHMPIGTIIERMSFGSERIKIGSIFEVASHDFDNMITVNEMSGLLLIPERFRVIKGEQ